LYLFLNDEEVILRIIPNFLHTLIVINICVKVYFDPLTRLKII